MVVTTGHKKGTVDDGAVGNYFLNLFGHDGRPKLEIGYRARAGASPNHVLVYADYEVKEFNPAALSLTEDGFDWPDSFYWDYVITPEDEPAYGVTKALMTALLLGVDDVGQTKLIVQLLSATGMKAKWDCIFFETSDKAEEKWPTHQHQI